MESIQQVKNRIGSIAGTRQITQSMRLVSTAKLQRVRDRMAGNREFYAEAGRIVRAAAAEPDARGHRFVRLREAPRAAGLSCLLVVGGDRGLCGGYTTNVCRDAQALIRELGAVRLVTVGQKVREFFLRRRRQEGVARSFMGISETPFFEDAEEIAACVLDWFERGEIDAVYLVYTHFENMLSLRPERKLLLPLGAADAETLANQTEPQEAMN
ncbi:MAG: F0F1 ATP synthase subunit gamma, partial [Clostridiales bacterium]|nr:F0F1 ATP synthase subunit gamma [Clostridiales bacterium]